MATETLGVVTNIQKAREAYLNSRHMLRPDIDRWIETIQKAKVEAPLPNSDYFHALAFTDGMMRRICYRFLMLTGDTGDGLICSLRDTMREMLRRISLNQGDARVIVVNGSVDALRELAQEFPRALSICEAQSPREAPIAHFIVGDYSMVRQEAPHPPLRDDSDAGVVKADIFLANPGKVRLSTERFDQMWQSLVNSWRPSPSPKPVAV